MILMYIILIVLLIELVINVALLFKVYKFDITSKGLFTHQNAEEVEASIIEELIKYCNSKGIKNAYFDTSGTTARLSYKKDGEIVPIVDLVFPITKVGTAEYNSSLEYQKELIDSFIGGLK